VDDQRTATKNKKPDVKIQNENEIKKDKRKGVERNIFIVFVNSNASQGVNLNTTKFTCTAVFLLCIPGSKLDPQIPYLKYSKGIIKSRTQVKNM